MRQGIVVGLLALLQTLLLPLAVVEPEQPPEPGMLVVESRAHVQTEETEPSIKLDTGEGVVVLPLEEYLVGVVLGEMPASFEPEALKAQAVAARTFTLSRLQGKKHSHCDLCADSRCCQAWLGEEAAREKLGEAWESSWNKIRQAVTDTAGQVLTYEGELIEAVYFSCSGGTTEDAVAVWGSDVPYLQSVESAGEETAAPYESTRWVSWQEFRKTLEKADPQTACTGAPESWIGQAVRTEGDGVATWELGGRPFSGPQLRHLFGLNSSKFDLVPQKEGVEFQVLGYGHRVGMSQYGANAMAKAGADYIQILEHYYTGVRLDTKKP